MYLGVDLGTSNSAIVGNDGHELRLYKTVDGADVLPSAIMIDRRGGMFIGQRAYEQDAFSPENVGKKFKRLMGTSSPIEFSIAGRTMTAEEASTEILKTLLAQAQLAAGDFELEGTIITIPAAFNQMQCEATMRAGMAAGLTRIGLVQEPIAAAMASIADRQKRDFALKDGQFLVYDLGGGTFDVAIVQSVGGTINIVGHGGINMLGGTDFDRRIVNGVVRPWLMAKFDLPADVQKNPIYQRVLRIAGFYAERAKIELSTRPTTRISADEREISARDQAGKEIYFDIPLERRQLEQLVVDEVDRSIDACGQLLKENGYRSDDIDRLVFIGGPTRMPIVRSRVPERLGISGDLSSDPMTAVAFGAAIFAESREWSGETVRAKPTRAITRAGGATKIEYGYPERTSDACIRIRIRNPTDARGKGYKVQVDSDMGWTSGQLALDDINSINDVPVQRRGDNEYRITIFDQYGNVVSNAETRIVVKRTDASSAGTPITHTIAVKIVKDEAGIPKNVLDELVKKGQLIPASGTKDYRAASDLRGGDARGLDFEVYQMEAGVADPALNLHVGNFRIEGTYLDYGDVIHRGDLVRVYWNLDENGLLNCALEVPSISRKFDTGKMFTDQSALKSFSGREGEELTNSILDTTALELEEMERVIGSTNSAEANVLSRRLQEQRETLTLSDEADTRRSIVEEARAMRQEISRIKNRPENVAAVLKTEVDDLTQTYDRNVRVHASQSTNNRFDVLTGQVQEALRHGRADDARRSYVEMLATFLDCAKEQPRFQVEMFLGLAGERHLAIDKSVHDRLADEGEACIGREDLSGLRTVIGQILANQYPTSAKQAATAALAGLMN
jgi:molecular chaperone DnaK